MDTQKLAALVPLPNTPEGPSGPVPETPGELAFEAQVQIDATEVACLQSAYDEVFRELAVRRRCFPRWVTEGRLSMTDAADRLARQERALKLLRLLLATRGIVLAEMSPGTAVAA